MRMSNTFDQMTDACTSVLNNVEHRVAVQRQLVESQRNMLETLKACNARLAALVHARPHADADGRAEQKVIEKSVDSGSRDTGRNTDTRKTGDICENSEQKNIRENIVKFRSARVGGRKAKKARRRRRNQPKYNVNYLVRIK
jgi:hypothetical protein